MNRNCFDKPQPELIVSHSAAPEAQQRLSMRAFLFRWEATKITFSLRRTHLKHLAWIVLLINLGAAVSYAEQTRLKGTLSGTNAPIGVDLQTGTDASAYDLAGSGSLGQFTLRMISASAASPQPSTTCSGLSIPTLAGEGVLRSEDGSLLKLTLTGGDDCIDLVAQQAHCTRTFQILGGTGRYRNASGGVLTVTITVAPVVPNRLQFFAVTGELTGSISGVHIDDPSQKAEQ